MPFVESLLLTGKPFRKSIGDFVSISLNRIRLKLCGFISDQTPTFNTILISVHKTVCEKVAALRKSMNNKFGLGNFYLILTFIY